MGLLGKSCQSFGQPLLFLLIELVDNFCMCGLLLIVDFTKTDYTEVQVYLLDYSEDA